MREVATQHLKAVNRTMSVVAVDGPGPGGASHLYRIQHGCDGSALTVTLAQIKFQNGALKEDGINGVTNEALLAIVIDRLEAFQNGPYKCEENAEAPHYLRNAACSL